MQTDLTKAMQRMFAELLETGELTCIDGKFFISEATVEAAQGIQDLAGAK
jgi:hypothetical protein